MASLSAVEQWTQTHSAELRGTVTFDGVGLSEAWRRLTAAMVELEAPEDVRTEAENVLVRLESHKITLSPDEARQYRWLAAHLKHEPSADSIRQALTDAEQAGHIEPSIAARFLSYLPTEGEMQPEFDWGKCGFCGLLAMPTGESVAACIICGIVN